MGGLLKMPEPPKPPKPVATPLPDDEAIRLAERRSLAASRARSGVRSTIRASAGGSLGQSGPGAGTVLGGAYDSFSGKSLGGS